jgi:hypothetical protein
MFHTDSCQNLVARMFKPNLYVRFTRSSTGYVCRLRCCSSNISKRIVPSRMHIVQILSEVAKRQNNQFTVVIFVGSVTVASAAGAAVVAVLLGASLVCHVG